MKGRKAPAACGRSIAGAVTAVTSDARSIQQDVHMSPGTVMKIPGGCRLANRRPRFQHSDVSGRHHFRLPNAKPPTVVTRTTAGYGHLAESGAATPAVLRRGGGLLWLTRARLCRFFAGGGGRSAGNRAFAGKVRDSGVVLLLHNCCSGGDVELGQVPGRQIRTLQS